MQTLNDLFREQGMRVVRMVGCGESMDSCIQGCSPGTRSTTMGECSA